MEKGGFAQVYPEHKYLIVAALQQKLSEFHQPVGMTGDGVNDAPALHRANIGIAVEGATDAATAAADIVLTHPGLSAVVSAIVTSRKIFTRMKNFVVYRIACTLQLLIFFLIASLAYTPTDYCATGDYSSFFYLPVSALVTIVILNDGTIISVAFDNVDSSKAPEEWNMFVLWLVASVVGGVALASSLFLLDMGLQCSANYQLGRLGYTNIDAPCHGHITSPMKNFLTETNMASAFGLDQLDFQEVKTMIYLKIALSDYLSLFNSRCRGWFFSRSPSKEVVIAALFSTICSSLLAHWWPFGSDMKGIPMGVVGFTWLWTIFWGLIQDAFKVATYWLLTANGAIKSQEAINEEDFKAQMAKGKEKSDHLAKMREKANLKILTPGIQP